MIKIDQSLNLHNRHCSSLDHFWLSLFLILFLTTGIYAKVVLRGAFREGPFLSCSLAFHFREGLRGALRDDLSGALREGSKGPSVTKFTL